MTLLHWAVAASVPLLVALPASAQNLFVPDNWSAMASDRRPTAVGDTITVIIQQVAESSNVTQNSSRRSSELGGSARAGSINESGQISFGGAFSGRGEVRRSESLVAQLSVTIEAVLPNGDFRVSGRQVLNVNGERTVIAVRGRIRAADVRGDNSVFSSRIADAEIDYDGKGFVSRSAKPGLLGRIFSFLGLI